MESRSAYCLSLCFIVHHCDIPLLTTNQPICKLDVDSKEWYSIHFQGLIIQRGMRDKKPRERWLYRKCVNIFLSNGRSTEENVHCVHTYSMCSVCLILCRGAVNRQGCHATQHYSQKPFLPLSLLSSPPLLLLLQLTVMLILFSSPHHEITWLFMITLSDNWHFGWFLCYKRICKIHCGAHEHLGK